MLKEVALPQQRLNKGDGIGGVLINIYFKDSLRHARENENENNLKQSFATTPKTDLTVEMVSVNDNKILSIAEVS